MLPIQNVYLGATVGQMVTRLEQPIKRKREFVAVSRRFLITACVEMKKRFRFDDSRLIAVKKLAVSSARSGEISSLVGEIMTLPWYLRPRV